MDIKQKASLFAASSALVLAGSKFAAGLVSGSMAVVSSGLDSLIDVFMSIMNFVAIRKAAEPADDSHEYGHTKAEDVAGLIQSLVIVCSGSIIIYRAVVEFIEHKTIAYSVFDFSTMAFSLAFTVVISVVLVRIAKQTGSNALKADALHYTSDLYSNSGAILAILLTYFTGIIFFDLAFAIVVGCIIIISAVKIFRSSLAGIMDASIPRSIEAEIEGHINSMPFPTVGFHKLRTRYSGSKKYIDFHLLTCRILHIDEAHEIASRLEKEITGKLGLAEVMVHIEPCRRECDLTEKTCSMVRVSAGTPDP